MLWSNSTNPALALLSQERILKHFVKRCNIEVGHHHELNYVVFTRKYVDENKPKNAEKKTLVLMHGYGLGLGYFFKNYDDLSLYFDRIIAVDWVGMGCSSRTSPRVTKISLCEAMKCDSEETEKKVAQQVTDEFIDSLEEWRKEVKLEKFVLAGHSLGGYLVSRYALKYPEPVQGLVLISPVGLPPLPPKETHVEHSALDWRIRIIRKLWDMNFTPQWLLRLSGSRGPDLVRSMVERRFAHEWQRDDLHLMSDYLYQISSLKGKGEFALNALLRPVFIKPTQGLTNKSTNNSTNNPNNKRSTSGVFAKLPLEQDLCEVKVPTLLMFGDHDWLYYPTAHQTVELWKEQGVSAKLDIIPRAGHHLYFENPWTFAQSIITFCKTHLA